MPSSTSSAAASSASSATPYSADLCRRLAEQRLFVVRYDQRDTGASTSFPRGEPGPGRGRAVELDRLSDAAMVALPRVCDQAVVEDALRARGIEPRIVFRTADNTALAATVRAGLGSAILPRLSVTPTEGIDVHALRPRLPQRSIYVQWRGTPTPLARRAIELVRGHARQLQTD